MEFLQSAFCFRIFAGIFFKGEDFLYSIFESVKVSQ